MIEPKIWITPNTLNPIQNQLVQETTMACLVVKNFVKFEQDFNHS